LSLLQLFLLVGFGFFTWFAVKLLRQRRYNKLFLKPLSQDWISILEKNVALYSKLPDGLQKELHGHVQQFLDKKEFLGKDLRVTDEIKLTIAGNACLLLLQGKKRKFEKFKTIIVYPNTFMSKEVKYDGSLAHQEYSARAGESWVRGPIVLSWKDTLKGSRKAGDGCNVVLHEFAHKLDEQNDIMDGLPILREKSDYEEWRDVFRKEYDALVKRAKRRKNKILDEYGTTSPPEFFAVATESFFEKPKRMQKKLPDLYAQLKKFYQVDPATWPR